MWGRRNARAAALLGALTTEREGGGGFGHAACLLRCRGRDVRAAAGPAGGRAAALSGGVVVVTLSRRQVAVAGGQWRGGR